MKAQNKETWGWFKDKQMCSRISTRHCTGSGMQAMTASAKPTPAQPLGQSDMSESQMQTRVESKPKMKVIDDPMATSTDQGANYVLSFFSLHMLLT